MHSTMLLGCMLLLISVGTVTGKRCGVCVCIPHRMLVVCTSSGLRHYPPLSNFRGYTQMDLRFNRLHKLPPEDYVNQFNKIDIRDNPLICPMDVPESVLTSCKVTADNDLKKEETVDITNYNTSSGIFIIHEYFDDIPIVTIGFSLIGFTFTISLIVGLCSKRRQAVRHSNQTELKIIATSSDVTCTHKREGREKNTSQLIPGHLRLPPRPPPLSQSRRLPLHTADTQSDHTATSTSPPGEGQSPPSSLSSDSECTLMVPPLSPPPPHTNNPTSLDMSSGMSTSVLACKDIIGQRGGNNVSK